MAKYSENLLKHVIRFIYNSSNQQNESFYSKTQCFKIIHKSTIYALHSWTEIILIWWLRAGKSCCSANFVMRIMVKWFDNFNVGFKVKNVGSFWVKNIAFEIFLFRLSIKLHEDIFSYMFESLHNNYAIGVNGNQLVWHHFNCE